MMRKSITTAILASVVVAICTTTCYALAKTAKTVPTATYVEQPDYASDDNSITESRITQTTTTSTAVATTKATSCTTYTETRTTSQTTSAQTTTTTTVPTTSESVTSTDTEPPAKNSVNELVSICNILQEHLRNRQYGGLASPDRPYRILTNTYFTGTDFNESEQIWTAEDGEWTFTISMQAKNCGPDGFPLAFPEEDITSYSQWMPNLPKNLENDAFISITGANYDWTVTLYTDGNEFYVEVANSDESAKNHFTVPSERGFVVNQSRETNQVSAIDYGLLEAMVAFVAGME